MNSANKLIKIAFDRISNKNKCKFGRFSYTINCTFEGKNLISSNTVLHNTCLGYGTYVGRNCELNGAIIGKYTCIGPRVINVTGNHPTRQFVSIHPAFFSPQHEIGYSYVNSEKFEEYTFADRNAHACIVIGNDVWIGANVIIIDCLLYTSRCV